MRPDDFLKGKDGYLTQSISFDRAAEFYDRTRKYPPEVSAQIADSVVRLVPAQARLLEVGIGTGRIAKPLMARGLNVAGVDLSRRMMEKLAATLPEGWPKPQIAQANAAYLPLQSRVFEAVVAVHVFHLIAEWHRALEEIQRVLQPGGMLLAGHDGREPDSAHKRLRAHWSTIVNAYTQKTEQPGVHDFEEMFRILKQSGADMDEIMATEWVSDFNLAGYIESLEKRIYSSTWRVPPEILPECVAELRAWARDEFGSLDKTYQVKRGFVWQRFRWL